MSTSMRAQRGVSLIELMIAMTLGAIVTAGVIQLFVSNNQTYNILIGQSRLQESARFAMEFIGRAAYGAGQVGCGPEEIESSMVAALPDMPEFNLVIPVEGYEGNEGGGWTPSLNALPRSVSNRAHFDDNEIDVDTVVAGTDVLVLRQARAPGSKVAQLAAANAAPVIFDSGDTGIDAGDVVVIADCEMASVFKVDTLTTVAGQTTLNVATGTDVFDNAAPFSISSTGPYSSEAIVAPIDTTYFFVAPGTGTNNRGDTPLALWRKLGDGPPVEMIEGVEDLQLLFGIDTTGDGAANRYMTPDLVGFNDTTASETVSVRVSLTVNSVNAVVNDGDGLIRRTFSQTFLFRNMTPE